MDIICKDCGHNIENHGNSLVGCCTVDHCWCKKTENEILYIYITEQQARLDTCREKVEALLKERNNLQRVLFQIVVECPFSFDDATIPKGGIDKAPEQVVVNMSIAWMKIVKAREALGLKVGAY